MGGRTKRTAAAAAAALLALAACGQPTVTHTDGEADRQLNAIAENMSEMDGLGTANELMAPAGFAQQARAESEPDAGRR